MINSVFNEKGNNAKREIKNLSFRIHYTKYLKVYVCGGGASIRTEYSFQFDLNGLKFQLFSVFLRGNNKFFLFEDIAQ